MREPERARESQRARKSQREPIEPERARDSHRNNLEMYLLFEIPSGLPISTAGMEPVSNRFGLAGMEPVSNRFGLARDLSTAGMALVAELGLARDLTPAGMEGSAGAL